MIACLGIFATGRFRTARFPTCHRERYVALMPKLIVPNLTRLHRKVTPCQPKVTLRTRNVSPYPCKVTLSAHKVTPFPSGPCKPCKPVTLQTRTKKAPVRGRRLLDPTRKGEEIRFRQSPGPPAPCRRRQSGLQRSGPSRQRQRRRPPDCAAASLQRIRPR